MARPRKAPARRDRMPDELMAAVAAQFRALGDVSRLRLLELLLEGPRSVTELAERAGLSHQNASKHLAVLSAVGLVARRRDGAHVLYATEGDGPERLCAIVCERVAARVAREHASARRYLAG
ncbi:MAG: helix-turn-helix transcriptional regulator [Planctomycetes bacterium]|nr:helix-turn-helix transcriptional regulator [Planctomycetota bacterium]